MLFAWWTYTSLHVSSTCKRNLPKNLSWLSMNISHQEFLAPSSLPSKRERANYIISSWLDKDLSMLWYVVVRKRQNWSMLLCLIVPECVIDNSFDILFIYFKYFQTHFRKSLHVWLTPIWPPIWRVGELLQCYLNCKMEAEAEAAEDPKVTRNLGWWKIDQNSVF